MEWLAAAIFVLGLLLSIPQGYTWTFAAVIAISTAIILGLIVWSQLFPTPKDNSAELVRPSISYKQKTCAASHPISVAFHNASSKVVEGISFRIDMRYEGHSDVVGTHSYQRFDKIMKPAEPMACAS